MEANSAVKATPPSSQAASSPTGTAPGPDTFYQNSLLNELEISQKKTVLESKPKRLGVTLTTICHLRCTMCKVIEIPWQMPERTIQEVASYFPYLEYIFWLGGEVFLSRQFEGLFEGAAASPHLSQALFTSGTLMTDKWAKKIVDANTLLTFSIDAFTKDLYEEIRVGAKFERLLEGIGHINSHRVKGKKYYFGINFTTMKNNYHEIENSVGFAAKNGFTALTINLVDEGGPSEDGFLFKDPEAAARIEAMLPDLFAQASESGVELKVFLPQVRMPHADEGPAPKPEKEFRADPHVAGSSDGLLCHLPWQYMFVGARGKVKPYCLCREDIGDVNETSLYDIWNNEGMQLYRKKILEHDAKGFCNQRCTDGVIPEVELKHPLRREAAPAA